MTLVICECISDKYTEKKTRIGRTKKSIKIDDTKKGKERITLIELALHNRV